MPSKRLLMCGLLSKVPERSKVLQRLLRSDKTQYTDAQKMHMVALFFTPDLPRSWISWQFESRGMNPDRAMRRLRTYAYNPEFRKRWEHLGRENLLYIGEDEVLRYFQRRNPHLNHVHIPKWTIPIINDQVKAGVKQTELAEKYDLKYHSLSTARRNHNMFAPPRKPMRNNWKP